MYVSIKQKDYKGLLDSGATSSVMGKELSDELVKRGLKIFNCDVKITTANKKSTKAVGYMKVPYITRGVRRIIPTLIMDKCSSTLILGMDFWHAYRIKPCFGENIFGIEVNSDDKSHNYEIVDAFGDADIQSPRCLKAEVQHELSYQEKIQLDKIVSLFPFCNPDGELNKTWLREAIIDTGDAKPVRCKVRTESPFKLKKIIAEIDRLEKRGIIKKIEQSEWLHPIISVPKPNGTLRICVDAREINAVMKKNAYPQQNVNRILGLIGRAKYITTIDLTDAYFQIPLHKDSQEKTAFAVPTRGTYVYTRMPMGLTISGAILCSLIDQLFGAEFEPFAFPYLDDIIIVTETFEQHLEVLEKVAKKLAYANLTISTTKSKFCYRRLKYLGHIIDESGIALDKSRIDAISNFPRPTCIREVQRLLGLAGWNRRFIKDFSRLTAPISELLKNKRPFVWDEECEKAFQNLIKALTEAPVLTSPDYNIPFEIHTDASKMGCGGVLIQKVDGEERIIAYMSQKFNAAQQKYQVTELECLGVIMGIEKFRPYVEGSHFKVVTDHHSLLWLKNLKDPAGRLARWALRLQAYDFTLEHRRGKLHVVPDCISRAISAIDIEATKETKDTWYNKVMKSVQEEPQLNDNFKIHNGLLYVKSKEKEDCYDPNCLWRICVPKEQIERIMKENHDNLSSCHFGKFKTLAKIGARYFWPGMGRHVEDYIKNCDICKKVKPYNKITTPPMGKFVEAKRIWRIIATDICGPYVLSKRGNRFLLVAIDVFSKFTVMKAVRTATAENVVAFIKNEVILKFGCPEIIISDNGVQYKSQLYKNLLLSRGIKSWYTANYFAQANPTECVNKVIGTAIRSYIKDQTNHRDWDENVNEIANAINQSVHTSTGQTPYEINFGQRMPQHASEYNDTIDVNESVANKKQKLEKLRMEIQDRLNEAHEKSKKYYNLRTRNVKYEAGDIVYRRNKQLSKAVNDYSSKTAHRHVKCKIVSKTGTNTYLLEDCDTGKRAEYQAQMFHK